MSTRFLHMRVINCYIDLLYVINVQYKLFTLQADSIRFYGDSEASYFSKEDLPGHRHKAERMNDGFCGFEDSSGGKEMN